MAAAANPFIHPLRVRWAETDPQGVVFNGHYLTYLDIAVTEYMRAADLAYPGRLEELGVDMLLVRSEVDYRSPARFDDELALRVSDAFVGNTSFTLLIDVLRGGELLAAGKLVYVTVGTAGGEPVPVPDVMRERLSTRNE